MEYKLNKIDTELRQKIKDTTKPGIVHRKNEIKINDHKREESSKGENFAYKLKNAKNKKDKIVVEGYKAENLDVQAYKEDVGYDGIDRGRFIDTKK